MYALYIMNGKYKAILSDTINSLLLNRFPLQQKLLKLNVFLSVIPFVSQFLLLNINKFAPDIDLICLSWN